MALKKKRTGSTKYKPWRFEDTFVGKIVKILTGTKKLNGHAPNKNHTT